MTQIPEDTYLPTSQSSDDSFAILILTANKTEDLEFFYPYYRFIEAGFRVDVATPDGGEFKGKQGLGLKNTMLIETVDPESYGLLYIPGGKAPAELKENDAAVELVRRFSNAKKPIAAICHGPQLLAEADVIRGRKISGWPEIEDEILEAGALYVNEEAIVDGQFITGRWPADLPAFTKKVLDLVSQQRRSIPKKATPVAA